MIRPNPADNTFKVSRWIGRFLLLGLLGTGACAPLTVTQERQMGREVAQDVMDEMTLVEDPLVVGYVQTIGSKIVKAAGPQPFDYKFYVVENDVINAFALPAGWIFVHTETILKSRNVSELAGVIGHEVGHVALRHIANNYRRQQGVGIAHQVGVLAAGVLVGGAGADAVDIGGGLAGTAYLNTFSREAEEEADIFAVLTLPKAGYDPEGLVTFFEVMQAESSGSYTPEFLRSHPTSDERIKTTQRLVKSLPPRSGLVKSDGYKLRQVQDRIRELEKRTK
jgi:predicted Zn-dependent protease